MKRPKHLVLYCLLTVGAFGLLIASRGWRAAPPPAPEAPPLETPRVFVFESQVLGALLQVHASIVRESYEQAREYFEADTLAEARRVLVEAERLRADANGEINNTYYRAHLRYVAVVKLCQRLQEPGGVYEASRIRLAETRSALQAKLLELRDEARDHKNNVRWIEAGASIDKVRALLESEDDEFGPEPREEWFDWIDEAELSILEEKYVHWSYGSCQNLESRKYTIKMGFDLYAKRCKELGIPVVASQFHLRAKKLGIKDLSLPIKPPYKGLARL